MGPCLLTLALFAGSNVSFGEALGLADLAPRVQAATTAHVEKRAFDRHISSLPLNPQVGIQPGFRLQPAPDREPELILDVFQPWNLGGQAGARRRTVELEEERLAATARATQLTQRLGAARTWIDLWGAQEVLLGARRDEAVAAELHRRVERLAEVGAATRADVAEARALHSEARLLVLQTEGEVYDRGFLLAAEIARPSLEPLRATGELPDPALPPPSDWPRLLDRAAALPAVAAVALEARALRARGVEERATRASVLSTGIVVQRDAPGGLVLSALLRLQPSLFDHGERERGVLSADAARAEGEHADAAVRARSQLAAAFHDVEHRGAVLAELRDQLVPASDEGAQAHRKIYDAGEATLLEVLQAQRVAIAARARLAHARADYAWARINLWLQLEVLSSVQR